MAALTVESGPAQEPITVTRMKNWLKIPANVTADDADIEDLIITARESVENFTARSIVNKTYVQSLDAFPYYLDSSQSQLAYPPSYYALPRYSTTLWNYSQMIKLRRTPLVEVVKIVYSDSTTGVDQVLLPALPGWQALHEFTIGNQIQDANGNLQQVSAVTEGGEDGSSTSGTTQPTWATVNGSPTIDGQLTWTCMGPAPAGGFVFDLDSTIPRLFPLPGQTWPPVQYVPNAVRIHFVAGYGNDGAAAPRVLLTAMRQLVTDWYYNREPIAPGSVVELPNHLKALLWQRRVVDSSPTRG